MTAQVEMDRQIPETSDENLQTIESGELEKGDLENRRHFELSTAPSNTNDPRRRAREFRGRQVQMMAISIFIH